MIFADNCYLYSESKEQIFKMIEGSIKELMKGLDWKEEEMQLMSWGFCEEIGDVHLKNRDKSYVIQEVTSGCADPQRIGLDEYPDVSDEQGGQSLVVGHDIIQKNQGTAEGRKHKRYRELVPSCILHSCDSWSWNKEMVNTLHGWESRKLDLLSFEEMGSNGTGFGMVLDQSDQTSKEENCRQR